VIGHGRYIAQGLTNLDPETGQGLPALNWTYGAHGVEIEIDTDEMIGWEFDAEVEVTKDNKDRDRNEFTNFVIPEEEGF